MNQQAVDCYRTFLGRDPDPEGAEAFAAQLRRGVGVKRLARELLNSAEFAALPPSSREAGWQEFARRFGAADHERVNWFHSITLPDGTVTEGVKPAGILRDEADAIFRHGVAGKTVLDIGAWDGFFSFEAERRGASVTSTDWFSWSGPGWGTKAGYDFAHRALGSKAASVEVDVPDLDPAKLGTFDVVLFLGVLYHLKNPLAGLEKAASMTKSLLVVETVTTGNLSSAPLMRYFPDRSMSGDPTNFWAPNVACLSAMLRDLGFAKVEVRRNPLVDKALSRKLREWTNGRSRHIVHAWK